MRQTVCDYCKLVINPGRQCTTTRLENYQDGTTDKLLDMHRACLITVVKFIENAFTPQSSDR